MIRDVLTIGDKRLLMVSQAIMPEEFNSEELHTLIKDMHDTMLACGGVGIAAVQIGYHKRVLLIGYDGSNPRYMDIGDCPLTVVINPQIEAVGGEVDIYNEGCLSVPDQRSHVSRSKHIRYKFYNQFGQLIEGESDTFLLAYSSTR